jgi:hypothetical protein
LFKRARGRPFFYPLSMLPVYESFPSAAAARARNKCSYAVAPYGINLPSALSLTREQVEFVVTKLKMLLNRALMNMPLGQRQIGDFTRSQLSWSREVFQERESRRRARKGSPPFGRNPGLPHTLHNIRLPHGRQQAREGRIACRRCRACNEGLV